MWRDFLLTFTYFSETLEFIYRDHIFIFNKKLTLIAWQEKRNFLVYDIGAFSLL